MHRAGQRAARGACSGRDVGERHSPLALARHHDRPATASRAIATGSTSSSRARRTSRDNVSTDNLRYGLHFMYSDSCDYERQHLPPQRRRRRRHVHARRADGRRIDSRATAAQRRTGCCSRRSPTAASSETSSRDNTAGLVADGATRLDRGAQSVRGQRVGAQAAGEHRGRTVHRQRLRRATPSTSRRTAARARARSGATTGPRTTATICNRDGVGDVPYSPVRLASVVVAQNEPALILLRSNFLYLLDAAERVFPALTPETLAGHRSCNALGTMTEPLVRITQLAKAFGALHVLRSVDLVVAAGRVMAVVGPNGAGKTTLIKSLLGLTRPDSGDDLVRRQQSRRRDEAYRARIGYMPQIARYPENLTGAELLAMLKDLRGARCARSTRSSSSCSISTRRSSKPLARAFGRHAAEGECGDGVPVLAGAARARRAHRRSRSALEQHAQGQDPGASAMRAGPSS